MTRPGPPPESRESLKLRGSWRANKKKKTRKQSGVKLTMPRGLKGQARNEWRRIIPALVKAERVCALDRTMLLLYVDAYAHYLRMRDYAEEVWQTPKVTGVAIRRATTMRNDAWKMLMSAAGEIGIVPDNLGQAQATPKPKKPGEVDKSKFFRDRPNSGK